MLHLTRATAALLLLLVFLNPAPARAAEDEQIIRGAYLTNLLGCGRCHTEGYLTDSRPAGPLLAGSMVGMAYTAYSMDESNPGVVFPSNLTGDDETGLGRWSIDDIVRAMTEGVAQSGHERLLIMPWVNYNALTRDDLVAIAVYLKTLAAVERKIPEPVPEGEPSPYAYVRYGTYIFEPHRQLEGTPPEPSGN